MADPNDYPKAVEDVAPTILRSVQALQRIATQSPNDTEAALRADAAVRFCHENKDFSSLIETLDIKEIAKKNPGSSNLHESVPGYSARGLPVEVYQQILHFVDIDSDALVEQAHKDRVKRLCNIAVSCRLLKPLTERLLYARPPHLKTVQQQWLFRFAVAVEPERGSHVRALDMRQQAYGANSHLQSSIARACPKVEDLEILRGHSLPAARDKDKDVITPQDFTDLAELLTSCPKLSSLEHTTWTPWEWQNEYGNRDRHQGRIPDSFRSKIQNEPRLSAAAARLKQLDVDDSSQWVFYAIFPHLSSKLQSLSLGQGLDIPRAELVQQTAGRCPALQELLIGVESLDIEDLRRGCAAWTDSLHTLIVYQNDDNDPFPVNFPNMKKLETLEIHCDLTIEALAALNESISPNTLANVEFTCLEHPEGEYDDDDDDSDEEADGEADENGLRDRMDRALCAFGNRHSKTLKSLVLSQQGDGLVEVGPDVFRACRDAERFAALYAGLYMPNDDTNWETFIGDTGSVLSERFFFGNPCD